MNEIIRRTIQSWLSWRWQKQRAKRDRMMSAERRQIASQIAKKKPHDKARADLMKALQKQTLRELGGM